jgi:hypothetical protein
MPTSWLPNGGSTSCERWRGGVAVLRPSTTARTPANRCVGIPDVARSEPTAVRLPQISMDVCARNHDRPGNVRMLELKSVATAGHCPVAAHTDFDHLQRVSQARESAVEIGERIIIACLNTSPSTAGSRGSPAYPRTLADPSHLK